MDDFMFLLISVYIVFIICIIRGIYLKLNFFKGKGLCLDCNPDSPIADAIYEYVVVEDGEEVKYKSEGTTFGYPRKGKEYKVLINNNDHTKVVGYSQYVFCWIFAAFLLLCMIVVVFL
ncbi:MAG: hypothetical protein K6E77_12815 [Lachnospiraceae bacterium]|nr:hypothetical protein [Lachnospiraceae bacterium]